MGLVFGCPFRSIKQASLHFLCPLPKYKVPARFHAAAVRRAFTLQNVLHRLEVCKRSAAAFSKGCVVVQCDGVCFSKERCGLRWRTDCLFSPPPSSCSPPFMQTLTLTHSHVSPSLTHHLCPTSAPLPTPCLLCSSPSTRASSSPGRTPTWK